MDQAGRKTAMERLGAFIGEWRLSAAFGGAAPAETGGGTSFEWALGGQFLLQHSAISHPAAPDGLSIVGPDDDGEGFLQHYFDSRGVVRLYAMTFDAGVWTLLRTTPDFSPLPFSQRYTGRFDDDGNAIRGRWETSQDGETWELDFELTYTRVA